MNMQYSCNTAIMFCDRQVVIYEGKELLFTSGPIMEWLDDKTTKVFCRKFYIVRICMIRIFLNGLVVVCRCFEKLGPKLSRQDSSLQVPMSWNVIFISGIEFFRYIKKIL